MGKYNLGPVSTEVNHSINKNSLFVNEAKANPVEKDMEEQLEIIRCSFIKIQELLNRTVNLGLVKGTRAEVFRGWAKKAKSQATSAEKLRNTLVEKYAEDVKNYPIQMLDNRIAELERKISSLID